MFAATIDKVSALLTLRAMRRSTPPWRSHIRIPDAVARKFLMAHGLIPPSDGGG